MSWEWMLLGKLRGRWGSWWWVRYLPSQTDGASLSAKGRGAMIREGQSLNPFFKLMLVYLFGPRLWD